MGKSGDHKKNFMDSDESDPDESYRLEANPEPYTILSLADIQNRIDKATIQVSTVLSLFESESSSILLQHYNWHITELQEEWLNSESQVRIAAGLPVQSETKKSTKVTCGICYDTGFHGVMEAAACGAHWYCFRCWKGYISSAISNGPGCLRLQCPDPNCTAAVGHDIIYGYVFGEDRHRYSRYLQRSYVDNRQHIKWCPSPGCEFAVEYHGNKNYYVTCNCHHRFCWNCLKDAHYPVDCETAAQWVMETPEAMSTHWILANTKPCPVCNRPIQKINAGCNYVICICTHKFCWSCLTEYKEHGFKLNCLKGQKNEAVRNEANQLLHEYIDYYDRWASNDKLKLEALEVLRSLDGRKLEKLERKTWYLTRDVEYIAEAWKQIVDCRVVLQWMHAYGYYYINNENGKKDYFMHVLDLAVELTEKLHRCATVMVESISMPEAPMEWFRECMNLSDLTMVTRQHFKNLVKALEMGLQDVGKAQPEGQKMCKFSCQTAIEELKRKLEAASLKDAALGMTEDVKDKDTVQFDAGTNTRDEGTPVERIWRDGEEDSSDSDSDSPMARFWRM